MANGNTRTRLGRGAAGAGLTGVGLAVYWIAKAFLPAELGNLSAEDTRIASEVIALGAGTVAGGTLGFVSDAATALLARLSRGAGLGLFLALSMPLSAAIGGCAYVQADSPLESVVEAAEAAYEPVQAQALAYARSPAAAPELVVEIAHIDAEAMGALAAMRTAAVMGAGCEPGDETCVAAARAILGDERAELLLATAELARVLASIHEGGDQQ